MQVYVTPRAEKNFDQIVDYLTTKWGETTAKQFIKKTDSVIKLLKDYPSMGPVESGEIRGFQLSNKPGFYIELKKSSLLF
ncbi:MAG: type II toxin-antitoxin system RelE/ParE family toxin [Cytophagales bacterium]|nr:type II toxin-antitoxin system RelE/ParE family toxin [Cytophagales bacterium]